MTENTEENVPFRDTRMGKAFVRSGESRETSPEIMVAIAFFARNLAEAETLWRGDGFGTICHPPDLWEQVTCNGRFDARDFIWGAAGNQWWPLIKGKS